MIKSETIIFSFCDQLNWIIPYLFTLLCRNWEDGMMDRSSAEINVEIGQRDVQNAVTVEAKKSSVNV
jgi:hypothetical protein